MEIVRVLEFECICLCAPQIAQSRTGGSVVRAVGQDSISFDTLFSVADELCRKRLRTVFKLSVSTWFDFNLSV